MQEEFALNALHVQNTITSAGPRSNRCSASNVVVGFFFPSSSSKKIKLFYTKHKKKSLLDLYHGNKQQRVLMKTWTSACFFDIVPGAGLLLIINQNDLHLYPFPGSLCFEEPSIEAVIYNINRQILKSSSSTC